MPLTNLEVTRSVIIARSEPRGVTAVSCVLYVTHIDSGTLLGIAGDIDRSNVDRLDDALALIDRGPIEVDCSKLDYIDASGI